MAGEAGQGMARHGWARQGRARQAKETEMTESEIQAQIVEYLELNRFLVFRLNSGRARNNIRLCPPGTPDLLVISRHGSLWWIEVKKPGEELRLEQVGMIRNLVSRGQNLLVARSVMDVKENVF